MYSDVVRDIGANRPTRLLTIAVVASLCERVPFGVVIAIPLSLTLLVAILTAGFLRDLGVPAPWPHIGGALWLLRPLGTEAALWPSGRRVALAGRQCHDARELIRATGGSASRSVLLWESGERGQQDWQEGLSKDAQGIGCRLRLRAGSGF